MQSISVDQPSTQPSHARGLSQSWIITGGVRAASRDNGPVLLPRTPGTYTLVLASAVTARIRVGRLGVLQLRPGHYVYVGSGRASPLAHRLLAEICPIGLGLVPQRSPLRTLLGGTTEGHPRHDRPDGRLRKFGLPVRGAPVRVGERRPRDSSDRKSTRLNS